MNCFEFRRLILAHPREITGEQEAHAAQCAACARLAKEIGEFETKIEEAALVPVPEALAERVLLRHRIGRSSRFGAWALAASLVAALGLGFYWFHDPRFGEPVTTAASLGTTHPAVSAISYVLDHEPQLLRENRSGDLAVMHDALVRLGLKLPPGVSVRYLGKCPVPEGTGEHVVLETPYGHATLILVPDRPLASRVVVSHRQMMGLAAPSRAGGGYILIGASLRTLTRVEKMLL